MVHSTTAGWVKLIPNVSVGVRLNRLSLIKQIINYPYQHAVLSRRLFDNVYRRSCTLVNFSLQR